jgi:hypothetical protein
LTLTIRHRQRNTVLNQTHTAHAERRARAEASRGHLQVLRIILSILNDEPWYAPEAFGEIHAQLMVAQHIAVDCIDGRGCIERLLLGARRGDHDGVRVLGRKTERGTEICCG